MMHHQKIAALAHAIRASAANFYRATNPRLNRVLGAIDLFRFLHAQLVHQRGDLLVVLGDERLEFLGGQKCRTEAQGLSSCREFRRGDRLADGLFQLGDHVGGGALRSGYAAPKFKLPVVALLRGGGLVRHWVGLIAPATAISSRWMLNPT